jgi:GT2 family glycosyltransferase
MSEVSIVIPSWNGRDLLERHLPAVLEACAGGEVVVCDDGSTDGTTAFLARRFPSVRVIARDRNGGFAAAVNDGMTAAGGRIAVCLNNDVRPDRGFLEPLLATLGDDPSLFAAVPRMWNPRFGGDESRTLGNFRRGLLDIVFPDRDGGAGPTGPTPVLYACGGAAAYRRERFLELGGFHPVFHPFYWEDVDLGWRAWRRGWGSVHVPSAAVHHEGGATIGARFDARRVKVLYERNRLLFLWSNLLDPALRRSHALWLGPRSGRALLVGAPFADALRLARRRLGEARGRRAREAGAVVLPDAEILRRCRG